MDEIEDPLQMIFADHVDLVYRSLDGIFDQIYAAVDMLMNSLLTESKILVAGNAMSASVAAVFCGAMMGRNSLDRPALPAINLTSDVAAIGSITQAYGIRDSFARQIKALGQPGDTLLLIASADKKNANLIEAIRAAHSREMTVVAMTADATSDLSSLLDDHDVELKIPSNEAPRLLECQLLIANTLCALLEQRLFGH